MINSKGWAIITFYIGLAISPALPKRSLNEKKIRQKYFFFYKQNINVQMVCNSHFAHNLMKLKATKTSSQISHSSQKSSQISSQTWFGRTPAYFGRRMASALAIKGKKNKINNQLLIFGAISESNGCKQNISPFLI